MIKLKDGLKSESFSTGYGCTVTVNENGIEFAVSTNYYESKPIVGWKKYYEDIDRNFITYQELENEVKEWHNIYSDEGIISALCDRMENGTECFKINKDGRSLLTSKFQCLADAKITDGKSSYEMYRVVAKQVMDMLDINLGIYFKRPDKPMKFIGNYGTIIDVNEHQLKIIFHEYKYTHGKESNNVFTPDEVSGVQLSKYSEPREYKHWDSWSDVNMRMENKKKESQSIAITKKDFMHYLLKSYESRILLVVGTSETRIDKLFEPEEFYLVDVETDERIERIGNRVSVAGYLADKLG